jgi:hypothetical protein
VAEPTIPSGKRRDGTSDGIGNILFKASGSGEKLDYLVCVELHAAQTQDEPELEVEGNAGTPVDVVIKATLPVCMGAIQAVPLELVEADDKKAWDEAEGISDEFDEVDIGLLFAFTSLQ